MKFQPKLFYLLITILITTTLCAQDLIVKTDGSRIFCQITKMDSLSIFYMRTRDNAEQKIDKVDVKKYYIAKKKAEAAASSPVASQHKIFVLNAFAGRPMPLGKFASKDLDQDNSGFALDGYMLGASLALKIIKEFGFNLSYMYQVNRFDHRVISDALNSNYPGSGFTATSTPWEMRGFFLGSLVDFNLKNIQGLSFRMEFKAGFPRFFQPEIVTRGQLNGRKVGITTIGASVRSLVVGGSAGLIYKFNRNVAFSIEVEYLSAKPYFSGTHKNTFGYTEYYSFEQPYKTIAPKVGLCFFFGNRKTQ